MLYEKRKRSQTYTHKHAMPPRNSVCTLNRYSSARRYLQSRSCLSGLKYNLGRKLSFRYIHHLLHDAEAMLVLY
jgi:hypothetical protein